MDSPDRFPHRPAHPRAAAITQVLVRVLVLNWAVALAKIVFGVSSGSVSILSDGFHSLTDGASNIVALVGVRAARKPPDYDHPYGHRKFETLAAAGIVLFLLLVMVGVLHAAYERLRFGGEVRVGSTSFVVMLGTLAVNIFVVMYETRAGRNLGSELLLADAAHTKSDILTSAAVMGALVGVLTGYAFLDPVVAILVAGFIGKAGLEVALDAAHILSDRFVLDEEQVRTVVMSVPETRGCHQIRTRGTADHVFLDLHVWFDPEVPLSEAHRLSHVVKDRLMDGFPEIVDTVIHIEPPPEQMPRPS